MSPAILVTGGAGYVGSHTVATLLEKAAQDGNSAEIIVVDNLSNAFRAPGQKKPEVLKIIEEMTGETITFYDTDIRNKEGLSSIFENHDIFCVIHFAALKAVGESVEKPLEYYQANITGTCTLLEVMRHYGVYKLVYSSSCTVYGEPQQLPINENHPTGSGLTSPYGKSKYFCEEVMKDLCISDNKWTVVSLRYFNPVGAHPSGKIGEDPAGIPNNLMPFIAQVAVGRLPELKVFGTDYSTKDGSGVRDYIHVCDLADGHVHAIQLLSTNSGFHAVNLGTGTGHSVLEMIAAFEQASGRKIPYKVVGRRSGDIAANYADVSLSDRLLRWRAKRTLNDMCQDTWRWQSNNPNGFNNDTYDEPMVMGSLAALVKVGNGDLDDFTLKELQNVKKTYKKKRGEFTQNVNKHKKEKGKCTQNVKKHKRKEDCTQIVKKINKKKGECTCHLIPKRAETAYLFWSKSARPKITAANPNLTNIEMSKLIGQIWRTVDKTEWQIKADKAKDVYYKEANKFKRSGGCYLHGCDRLAGWYQMEPPCYL